jgi:hypothetical protein
MLQDVIHTLAATDEDGNTVTFSIVGGAFKSMPLVDCVHCLYCTGTNVSMMLIPAVNGFISAPNSAQLILSLLFSR